MEQVSTPNRAGIFQGEQHSETGIPLALIDTGSRIEVEGGEFNFPEWVQTDKKIYTISGTNYKVIQQLFKLIGAEWDNKVTHVKSGDIIICIRSAFDDEVRTYTGTLIQIISAINESRGCKHVQSGATMTNHETGATVQMKNGGRISPNGKLSNLNEMQWHLVRTPEFKKWFGDWEKAYTTEDYTGVSMALDENKEPLVLYHGTTKDFNVFDISKATKNTQVDWGNLGFFFTPDESLALDFTRYKWAKSEKSKIKKGSKIIPVFLNIKLPHYITARQFSMYHEKIDKAFREKQMQEYDGWIITKFSQEDKQSWIRLWGGEGIKEFLNDQYVVFESNQIKLADGTNTTFDASNPDIRKIDGGQLPELNDEGGYEYKDKDEKIADRCGLITLPKSITGTNCSNCIFQKDGFCDHEKILLPVTKRMCCAMWSDKSLGSIISNITKADFFPDKKLKEKEYPLNENGGYDYIGSGLKRAKAVDLITLPKNIEGTNCAYKNCRYTDSNNFCTHPKIMLPVTDRMSCGWYDADGIIRPWGKPVEIDFSKQKEGGKQSWIADSQTKKYSYKAGGRVAQGYIIAPYSKLKKIFGEPNVKNEKEKIGWYMAIDKNHIGAIWTEADKSVKEIKKEKFHKWFLWGANEESQRRLHEATHSQVRDIDPEKQKEKDKAISVQRWVKKRDHITQMANNIHKIKLNVSRDMNSSDEKEFLTALVVAVILQTSERIGNEDSAKNGHCGVTGFQKSQINIIGNKVLLDYVGKSGVEHEKSFTDKRIAKALKKAIKNSPSKYVFETSDGFKIKCDKVSRYLEQFQVSPKNLRGFNANKFIIKKIESIEIPEEEKARKKIFNQAVKQASQSVGHSASTLKKHYMIPELMDEYVLHSRIIDMKKLGYYDKGGEAGKEEVKWQRADGQHPITSEQPEEEQPKQQIKFSSASYFLNPVSIPDAVKLAGLKLDKESADKKIHIQEVFRSYPVKEISFKDVVPMQEDLYAHKLEEFINSTADDTHVFPIPSAIEYEGKYYWNDGHHRAVAFHLNGKPILAHVFTIGEKMANGGLSEDKQKEAERMAKEFLASLSAKDLQDLKQKFTEVVDSIIVEEEKKLKVFEDKKSALEQKRKDLYEKEKTLTHGEEKTKIFKDRMDLSRDIAQITHLMRHQENIVKTIKNGGDLSTFTDRKGTEHKNIPFLSKIKTDLITFDEDSILTDGVPPYIPLIDEETFRQKGYVFDAIRIAPDEYLIAVNGYHEAQGGDYSYKTGKYEGGIHPTDNVQGYVMTTLDQLALINDYYFTKAKAEANKEAEEKSKRNEEYYDKLSREKRESHLNQKGFYNALPVKIKKTITQAEYEKLSLEEKEKLYKPYKRYGAKRLVSKLDETHMWKSYHNMYERFINPKAVPPKAGYANEEVFYYWQKFRDMMKWKIKDIQVQRESESEIRKIALETSFGESNTNDSLKEKYGILVKRQNGTKIMPAEIDQIRKSWEKLNKTFGAMANNARAVNLKISHTGLKYVFASKSAGIFIPSMKTIAVSNKFGDDQFEGIFAHETAHWIDYSIGQLTGKRYATDNFESTAGIIADTLRYEMNEPSDSDYVNATKECFARAMEQYFAFENFGEEATLIYSGTALDEYRTYHSEDKYVSKEVFNTKLKPLIQKFLAENSEWFQFGIEPERKLYGGVIDGFNDKALDIAKQMRLNKISPELIWEKTMWYFNEKDGNWRNEISDDGYRFKLTIDDIYSEYYKKARPIHLEKLITHDLIFKLTPELKKYFVIFKEYTGGNVFAEYDNRKTIVLYINFKYYFEHGKEQLTPITNYSKEQILLTEIMSVYQARFRFAKDIGIEKATERIRRRIEESRIQREQSLSKNDLLHARSLERDIQNLEDNFDQLVYLEYTTQLGEIEARDVAERIHLTEAERRKTFPLSSSDIPEDEIKVTLNNGGQPNNKNNTMKNAGEIKSEKYHWKKTPDKQYGIYNERGLKLTSFSSKESAEDYLKNANDTKHYEIENLYPVKKSKYNTDDKVYSWQNTDYPAPVVRKMFSTWTSVSEPHENDTWKYLVRLKDGNRSKWMSESYLFKTKQDKYIDGGGAGKSAQEILAGLKNEIEETLYFFVQTDLNIYGYITEGTVSAFKTQGVEFPETLMPFVNKKMNNGGGAGEDFIKAKSDEFKNIYDTIKIPLKQYQDLTDEMVDKKLWDEKTRSDAGKFRANMDANDYWFKSRLNKMIDGGGAGEGEVTTIIISSSAPLSTALQALTGSHWTMQSFEGTSEDFTEIATGRKFKSYTLEKAKEQGITGIMIPSEGTIYNFYLKADEQGAHKTAMEYINNNLLTPELVDDLLQGYATGMPYDEKHKLIVSLNKLPETEFGGAMEEAGEITMEQSGQRLSMHIGNQTMWVERRPDNSQPNPYDGLNYFIYSSPLAQFAFMGAQTWAAFVHSVSRIASGVLDDMINADRLHYEKNK